MSAYVLMASSSILACVVTVQRCSWPARRCLCDLPSPSRVQGRDTVGEAVNARICMVCQWITGCAKAAQPFFIEMLKRSIQAPAAPK